jgi:hypothetical protein
MAEAEAEAEAEGDRQHAWNIGNDGSQLRYAFATARNRLKTTP